LPEAEVEMAKEKEAIHEATKHNPYDTPEHAVIKYLITFKLPPQLVDDIATEMLRNRGFSEASFCEEFYMNEQHIQYLSDKGHVIGNHGHTHVPFTRLEEKQLQEEIKGSKSYFENLTGTSQNWISYPHGRQWAIPSPADEFCKHFGFTIGLGVDAGWNKEGQSPYLLNRVNPNEVEGVAEKQAQ
jgi:peptidoglycan/xylan/chitin deacetylase (PgdA/CDA1 family)